LPADAFFPDERPIIVDDQFPWQSTGGAAAQLGWRIFFDERLSRTGTTACASCHRPEYSFADPRRVSVSDSGRRGQRHAPSLINAGFSPLFMWDGAFSNA